MLEKATTGKVDKPHFVAIYGTPGVGKSTFAADAPKPIFIDLEDGTEAMNVTRIKPANLEEFYNTLSELRESEHGYESIVIDTLDHLVDKYIVPSVEKKAGKEISKMKWGSGFTAIKAELALMVSRLEDLRINKRMNVILVAHAKIKATNNPSLTEDYDKFQLRMNEGAAALITQEVDTLLFANYEIFTHETEIGKVKGIGDGRRVIHTICMPSYDAKNRFNLPGTLPLSWSAFVEACESSSDRDINAVQANITDLVNCLKDEKTKGVVETSIKDAKDNMGQLLKIENRLKEITKN